MSKYHFRSSVPWLVAIVAVACSKAQPNRRGVGAKLEPVSSSARRSETTEEAEDGSKFVMLAEGVRISRLDRRIEADAKVCLVEGGLELLVTTPDGKPHEAIFTLDAKPRHLHAALLALGYASGKPGSYGKFNATGDPLRIDVAYKKNGKDVVVPVNELVVNRETREYLPENVFVFAGSLLCRASEGKRTVYAADVVGDIVSLVSFPDEVLALPESSSSRKDSLMWSVDGSKLPKVGTPVVLRIGPVEQRVGEIARPSVGLGGELHLRIDLLLVGPVLSVAPALGHLHAYVDKASAPAGAEGE